MSENQELPRAFKGIWIPREIWLHPELDCFEKVLWAEIDSLDDPERGCIASNAYLCKLLKTQERTLQLSLSKLKKLGFIKYVAFDGRTRVMRSCLKTSHEKFDTPLVKNLTPLPCKNLHPERIEEKIDKIPPPLTPFQQFDPEYNQPPPNEEEEIEIEKRKRERPPRFPPIKNMKAWKAKVLEEIRIEKEAIQQRESVIEKHRKEANLRDGAEMNGWKIYACTDRVEFTRGSMYFSVPYNVSDAEWKQRIGQLMPYNKPGV